MHQQNQPPGGTAVRSYTLSAAWGFAEATLFFIVPDVLLTWLAIRSPRLATWACGWALLGALIGGSVMYAWGAAAGTSATDALLQVPAVDQAMLDTASQQLDQSGAAAVLSGPLAGRPYKIYAVLAPAADVSLPAFLALSIPARLGRFLLTTWLTALLAGTVLRRLSLTWKRVLLVACWVGFYAWFFAN
jgi:membrane protein YqaA with SNARE-associated domain